MSAIALANIQSKEKYNFPLTGDLLEMNQVPDVALRH